MIAAVTAEGREGQCRNVGGGSTRRFWRARDRSSGASTVGSAPCHRCPHSDSNGCLDPVSTGSSVALDLVFPDANDEPSLTAEPSKIEAITTAIPFDLVLPVSGQLAAPPREAPAMPVVAVDEDSHFRVDENDVGSPRQPTCVLAESEAPSMKQSANRQFRLSVFAADQ